jgi:outer membrane biosynthesis protein TonB
VIEVVGGVARTSYQTDGGSIDFDRNRDYWLRAETGSSWINLYWSVDGNRFEPVGVFVGVENVSGGVGLVAGGASVPDVDFDDFIARKSQSAGPIQVEEPAPTAAPVEVADPTQAPTEEAATPEPAPTEEPTATEEPAPTEEPTATPEPTVEPEPTLEPTATPEPATEEAAPEPPVDGESTPENTGDAAA